MPDKKHWLICPRSGRVMGQGCEKALEEFNKAMGIHKDEPVAPQQMMPQAEIPTPSGPEIP